MGIKKNDDVSKHVSCFLLSVKGIRIFIAQRQKELEQGFLRDLADNTHPARTCVCIIDILYYVIDGKLPNVYSIKSADFPYVLGKGIL